MSHWPSLKAKQLFRVIQRLGWRVKAEKGSSHKQMVHDEYGEATWAFHDREEIGPKMMGRIAKVFRFEKEDL